MTEYTVDTPVPDSTPQTTHVETTVTETPHKPYVPETYVPEPATIKPVDAPVTHS